MHCKTMLSLSQILLFQGLKASATYLYQNVYRIRPLPPPPPRDRLLAWDRGIADRSTSPSSPRPFPLSATTSLLEPTALGPVLWERECCVTCSQTKNNGHCPLRPSCLKVVSC